MRLQEHVCWAPHPREERGRILPSRQEVKLAKDLHAKAISLVGEASWHLDYGVYHERNDDETQTFGLYGPGEYRPRRTTWRYTVRQIILPSIFYYKEKKQRWGVYEGGPVNLDSYRQWVKCLDFYCSKIVKISQLHAVNLQQPVYTLPKHLQTIIAQERRKHATPLFSQRETFRAAARVKALDEPKMQHLLLYTLESMDGVRKD